MASDKKKNPVVQFLEGLTILMIVLVIVQTFLEDFLVLIDIDYSFRQIVILNAVFFDIFFTFEFFIRLFSAVKRKEGKKYFFHRNGWIDLLASLPLLLFVSGPFAFAFFFKSAGGGFRLLRSFSMIKVIKAIRVTRILRLLRVLKIFGKIKNTESPMAQRHISVISTIVVLSLIFFMFTWNLLEQTEVLPTANKSFYQRGDLVLSNSEIVYAKNSSKSEFIEAVRPFLRYEKDIFSVEFTGDMIYSKNNMSEKEVLELVNMQSERFEVYSSDFISDFKIYFDTKEILHAEAVLNLYKFFIIIFVLLMIVIVYSKHFAQTVTDPIFVMRNGFEKMDYTLAVKIPENYKDDDIFRLSHDFNSRWLPAKIRKLDQTNAGSSKLSMNDILGNKGL